MNESITSVSKKEQKFSDAAAAITVLSNDDLRRSGATTLMEALRLVPGLNVGEVNSSQWAISSRGFNDLYAKKMLVLIDGRAVYDPLFAGVFWDLQQMMLADVERIEIIRGPGATIWGANAVNGVINVVTRSAKETQGGLLEGGGGNVHQSLGGLRYGGKISDTTYYRVFGSHQLNDDYRLANGHSADDGWQVQQGGFRIDDYPDNDTQLTWQGDGTFAELNGDDSKANKFNTLGRWTRTLSERSNLEFQAYYDRTYRSEIARARYSVDIFDLTAQHTFGLGQRNNIIWGLGYRFINNRYTQTNTLVQVEDSGTQRQLFSIFAQDEFQLVPDKLILTAGNKIEHNDFTGFEFQPSVRAVYKPTEQQTVWSAISRAVRTPSEVEGKKIFAIGIGAPFAGPGGGFYIPTIVGNTELDAEVLWAYELGYRVQPAKRLSVDLASFYNEYSKLIENGIVVERLVPGTPFGRAEIPLINIYHGETYGGEAAVTIAPTDDWRLTGGYTLLITQLHGSAGTNPQQFESRSPQHQFSLRSAYDITRRLSLDAQLRYVDNIQSVSSYITADIRLSSRVTDRLELSLVGQNLFDKQHPEQGPTFFVTPSEVPRGFYGKVVWRF